MQSVLKSMTAYGRATVESPVGRFTVEIQGLNRRHFEPHISLPRPLVRFEMQMRKQFEAKIGRGQLNVFVTWQGIAGERIAVQPNLPLAEGMKEALEKIAHHVGVDPKVDLSLLVQEKEMLRYEEEIVDEAPFVAALESVTGEALDNFLTMKREEGQRLACDFAARLETLTQAIGTIEGLSGASVEKQRKKLSERLEALFTGSSENEERLLREVALLAEKADITEEIVRFKSHLEQFRQMMVRALASENETRGKTLDFLLQELGREINTVGSKSGDTEISHAVVLVKSELEKMREQVQNIE